MEKILILAFYQFINISDLESLKNKLTEYCVLERIK
jgi:predicted sulfurtransferase